METSKITKQMIKFQKMSFDNWYSAMSLMQDQAVSTMDTMLGQARWLPADGRDAIQNWVGDIKDERNRFKGYVDNGFVSLEKILTSAAQTTTRAKKSAN
jgi:hypothetical protein